MTIDEARQNNVKFWEKYHEREHWTIFGYRIKKFSHVSWCHVCNGFDLEKIKSKIRWLKHEDR